MRKNLAEVLHYFGFFSYAPTFEEIRTFFPSKITVKSLKVLLSREVKRKKLVRLPKEGSFQPFAASKYTLPQYSIRKGKIINHKETQNSKWAVETIQLYVSFLKTLSFIRFVGITGTTAMTGQAKDEDVDLFVITKSEQLWTTRFVLVVVAKLLGIHGGNGVCLNLFFDENGLEIPKIKQNIYIAHELLQMKPVVDKKNTYSRLMHANEWMYRTFPNTNLAKGLKLKAKSGNRKMQWLENKIEQFLKSIQLPIIQKNRTGFRITDHQLWLFKRDFELKLKKRKMI